MIEAAAAARASSGDERSQLAPGNLRSAVVAEARSWIGTPFVPQQSVKGSGCDCKGLLAGVARDLGRDEAGHAHAVAMDYSLSRVPAQRFKAGIADLFDPVAGEPEAGDVLLLRVGAIPAHLAICTEPGLSDGRAVHACVEAGVRETRLRALVKLMPVDSIWRFRPCQ